MVASWYQRTYGAKALIVYGTFPCRTAQQVRFTREITSLIVYRLNGNGKKTNLAKEGRNDLSKSNYFMYFNQRKQGTFLVVVVTHTVLKSTTYSTCSFHSNLINLFNVLIVTKTNSIYMVTMLMMKVYTVVKRTLLIILSKAVT